MHGENDKFRLIFKDKLGKVWILSGQFFTRVGACTAYYAYYTTQWSGSGAYTRFFILRTSKFRPRLGVRNISPIWASMFLILFLKLDCS